MITIILAGGLGTRMKVNFPKVLLKVNGIPMIIRTITNAISLKSEMIIIVVNESNKDQIEGVVKKYVKHKNIFFAIQNKPLGTGDAVKSCIPYLEEVDPFDDILILFANMPLLSFYTLNTFIRWRNDNDSRILCSRMDDPSGYGRIVRDVKLNFIEIKEDIDCDKEERKIKHVNVGIFMIKNFQILQNINSLKNNNKQNEYYITDLMNIIKPSIYMLESKFNKELINVNDREALKKIELFYKKN